MDLEDFDNGTAYARYRTFGVGLFSVDPEDDGYPLTVADYSGTAGRAPGCPPMSSGRTKEVLPGQVLPSFGVRIKAPPFPPSPTWSSSQQWSIV